MLIYSTCKNYVNEIIKVFSEEFKMIFKEKATILIFFVATLFYPIVYSTTYSTEVLRNVPIVVIDNNNSSLSRQYVRMLDATETVAVIAKSNSFDEAKQLFKNGKIQGIVVIPEDFSKNIYKKTQTFVSAYADATYFIRYKQVIGAATSVNGLFNAQIQVKEFMMEGIPQSTAVSMSSPIETVSVPLYNPNDGYGSYVMPAILLLVLQQTLLIGIGIMSGGIKERKSYQYLLPLAKKKLSGSAAVIGKGLAYFTLYMGHIFYLFFIVYRLFNFPYRGDLLTIYLFLIPFILAIIFLGFIISSLFRTKEMSMLMIISTTIPFMFISGISWPVESMPTFISKLAVIIPSTTGINGFVKINQMGATLWEVRKEWYTLWVLAFVYFVFAAIYFRLWIDKIHKEHKD